MARRRGVTPFKLARARVYRERPTASEALAWEILRDRRMLGLKWRRQQVIYGYVADFFCVEHRLVLEIDGGIHLDPQHRKRDADRPAHLRSRGLVILRIQNDDVDRHELERILVQFLEEVPPSPTKWERGQG